MYKKIILEGQERIMSTVPRKRQKQWNYEILKLNKIITFVGPRRSGKTYFMIYSLRELIEQGVVQKNQIVFVDFTAFFEGRFDIDGLLESYFELCPDSPPFFVFDEIQELPDFTKIILSLFNKNYKIFLSGSNSKLLSSELSTQFRGRTYDITISPLSWREYCDFKNIKINEGITSEAIGNRKNAFSDYMRFGGYPEVVLIDDINIKEDVLKSYFEVVLYKDLLERYSISNEFVIKFLFKKLILSNTKEFSVNKTFNELKSQGIKVGVQTLYTYIEYLKQIFLLKEIGDLYKKTGKKYYFLDVGFMNLIDRENFGQRFENIVFLELTSRFKFLSYLISENEIDFVIKEKDIAIQVCFDLTFENYEREVKSLRKSNFQNKYIIYLNKYAEIQNRKNDDIKIISFFEFLE
ncbi:MAG: ATP-binding protein, partial [Candidatus Gracilibacteria bacterium]|nr:ATP-binding protein [Candidatus Gracilibacteria bacterium]